MTAAVSEELSCNSAVPVVQVTGDASSVRVDSAAAEALLTPA